MIKVKNLILFPHLPKTGGSSLANNIIHKLKNEEEYFRISPKGRRDLELKRQFETTEDLEQENLLLYGHGVGEGLFNFIEYENHQIYTTLRHPLKRLISQFNNMSNYLSDLSISLDNYISQKLNPSCLWYIRKFPSLVNDPFSPILTQCFDIFSYFTKIYFVEDSDKDFNDFMQIFGKKFDNDLNINQGGIDYEKRSRTENVKTPNITANLNQDNLLYNIIRTRQESIVAHKVIPKKQWKFNRWMRPILNNTLWLSSDKDTVLSTVKNSVCERLVKDQLNESKLNLNTLLQSIYDMPNFESLSEDEKANVIDLLNFIFSSKQQFSLNSSAAKINIQELILKTLKNQEHDITKTNINWNDYPENNEYVILAKINMFLHDNNHSKAEEYMIKYCTISPYKVQPFLKLGRFYSKFYPRKEKEILLCAEKVIEFDSPNKWANNQLKKLIIRK